MLRAWAFGIVMLLAADGMWLIAIYAKVFSGPLLLFVQILPILAAFVSAYLAPRKKIMLGTSMAVPAAFIVVAVTMIYQLLDKPVDFPGLKGGELFL